MRTEGRCAVTFSSISWRSSRSKSGCALLRVAQRGHDDLVEEPAGPLDDFEMTVVEGVERSREEADLHESELVR